MQHRRGCLAGTSALNTRACGTGGSSRRSHEGGSSREVTSEVTREVMREVMREGGREARHASTAGVVASMKKYGQPT